MRVGAYLALIPCDPAWGRVYIFGVDREESPQNRAERGRLVQVLAGRVTGRL